MPARDRPLLTDIYDNADAFTPQPGSAYVFATSTEQRSIHSDDWERRAGDVRFARIVEQRASTFDMGQGAERRTVSLRSNRQLESFWKDLRRGNVYLDITGLGHHVWAPLLKSALSQRLHVMGVYVEPIEYRFSASPTEGEIFDLSERISGISPIPGFATLSEAQEQDVCFVPLLGFEGTRFAYIVEQVQPAGGKTFPVVGVPGFRPEYPFHTYLGNRSALTETRSWKNVKYATANCPFSLFYALQEVADKFPRDSLKIAPIGTKPHALGAVLYALVSRRSVELVYDHPIRKRDRTEGAARLLVYHISTFAAA